MEWMRLGWGEGRGDGDGVVEREKRWGQEMWEEEMCSENMKMLREMWR